MISVIQLLIISQILFLSACRPNEVDPEFLVEKEVLALEHKRLEQTREPTERESHDKNITENKVPSPDDEPASDLVEEIPSEPETDQNIQIEEDPLLPSYEEEDESQESEPSQKNQVLYLENGPGRDYYETKPYLSSTEKIPVSDGEKEFASIEYKNYKIVTDKNNSSRQGIALYFVETNLSDEKIEVGLAGRVLNPVLNASLFYGEDELKKMPPNDEWLEFADATYIETQHVSFTPRDAKTDSCTETKTLKPGKSRECYVHYSYPGPGEYLINQAISPSYTEFKSFTIEVE